MFGWIVGFLALIFFYRRFKILWNRRKYKNKFFPVMDGAESFFIRGKGKKKALLLIHGFTSSPDDFRYMRKYFKKKGITLYAPLMKGHGTSPYDLANTNWKDWYGDCKKAYLKLKREGYEDIYVLGASMGGNLAFMLTGEYRSIKGIITVGTPIFFRAHNLVRLVCAIYAQLKAFKKKQHPQEILDSIKGKVHYHFVPMNKMGDVYKVIGLTRNALSKIKCPALIIQSTTDQLVSEKSIDYISNNIKSKMKKIVWIEDAYHVVILDKYKKEKAFKEIESFIKYNES